MFGNYDRIPGEVVEKRQSPDPDPELAQALNFDREDLQANRAGWLTVRQEKRLSDQHRTSQRWMITFGIAAMGIAISWSLASTFADFAVEVLVLGAAVILIALVQILSILQVHFQQWQSLRIDAGMGGVASITGPVTLTAKGGGGGLLGRLRGQSPHYTLAVAGLHFHVTAEAYYAFHNLGYYTVYYTPQARVILSAEVITT